MPPCGREACRRQVNYSIFFVYSQYFVYVILTLVIAVISYRPFYATLFRKGVTEYNLIYKQGVPPTTIHRMKHGKGITTATLNTLCEILECRVEDILEYIPDGED